ncbi:MAG: SPOR domain-containing protein [Candidatus Omnitrophota bacterium]|nr:MAG: SPOR domain-containing protein [Candidatus Omnitrophota bacterium]
MFNSSGKDKQAEFFSDLPQPKKKTKKKAFALTRIAISLSYENLIFLAIGSVMILMVSYSLGVERGKGLNPVKTAIIKVEAEEEEIKETPTEKRPEAQKKIRIEVASGKYTIQVATLRRTNSVEKELKRLENRGYAPFVINRGKFSEICVGDYKDKSEAYIDLKKLKSLYADCYMRNK